MVEDVIDTVFLLQLQWPLVNILDLILKKKWHAYVSMHSLSVCQVWTPSVNACPRNGWGRVQHQVFFTTKMAASRPSWIWCRKKKWHAYVYHHVLSLCKVWIKSVHTCPRYGCRRKHGHENWDKIHQRPFLEKVLRWLMTNFELHIFELHYLCLAATANCISGLGHKLSCYQLWGTRQVAYALKQALQLNGW